jgi:amino acid permease
MIDELAFWFTVYKIIVLCPFSIFNHNHYSVIITAAENPVLFKYVLTKGSKTYAFSDKLSCFSQAIKTEEVTLYQTCHSRKHCRMCL